MIGTLGYFLLEYHNDATIGKLGCKSFWHPDFSRDDEQLDLLAVSQAETDFGIQVVWMYFDVYRRFSGRYGRHYQDDDNGHLAALQ